MQWHNHPAPLIVILGPTAVGKTELSIRLAENLGAEIVSADSRLLYRGMDIGTAKPSRAEQARAPHHLIDVTDPDHVWSLVTFQQAVRETIAGIHQRGRLPLLVGGTGQYVRAMIEDWEIPAQAPHPELRAALEQWGAEIGPLELHRRLAIVDPLAGEQIQAHNMRRTIRALEVIFGTGERFSTQRRQAGSPYSLLLIGIKRPRAELYARIDARIEQMLADGLLAEVQSLLDRGYSPDLAPLSAIGYREMIAVLRGEMSLDEAVMMMKRLTRNFVRRQANWFKETDPTIHWFDAEPDPTSAVLDLIRSGDGWLAPQRSFDSTENKDE